VDGIISKERAMTENLPFFWQNSITIGVLAILLLMVAVSTTCLLVALYFRGHGQEALLHLIVFLVASGCWAVSAWNPPAHGCDHSGYCWQFPVGAAILIAQCIWLFLRFLVVEQLNAQQVVDPHKQKIGETWRI